jgi:protocatechuate 3,4-dioxygenase alpha subunit
MTNFEDIECQAFSSLLATKLDHYPYSDKLLEHLIATGQLPAEPSMQTQRQLMALYFQTNASKLHYTQTPCKSARHRYNQLTNPASLLWIAEAVGINELTVRQAFDAAFNASSAQNACGAIRKIITWDMIYTHS